MWYARLHDVYEGPDEWEQYSNMFGLHYRLGYTTPTEAWEDNPYIKGSTNPEDYGLVV